LTITRRSNISREEVAVAWEAVRKAGGGAGADNMTIGDVINDEDNQLYKVWNRLNSGSYMAQPVKLVKIPKATGGMRTLGIPTVTDRVAQMVIRNRLEPLIEPLFHEDSFAYRPGRSAEQAVGLARERCFRSDWVLDIDIQGFFDNLEHEHLMTMVRSHSDDAIVHLYIERFLKADGIRDDGEKIIRDKGTPQGGVISPLLANLYLHEAFDKWMADKFPEVGFERYADDIIVHCVSENQAYFMKNRIEGRLALYGLKMHPEKTKVVYTGTAPPDDGEKGSKSPRKFTFLGYEFKPRSWKKKLVFTPAIGSKAKKTLRIKMKAWALRSKVGLGIFDIAALINRQVRGWFNYYGHYRRSALYAVAMDIDLQLVKWIRQKYKLRVGYNKAWNTLKRIKSKYPEMFCHWYMLTAKPIRAV